MRVARRNAEWLQALVPVQLNLNGGYHALGHLPTFSIDQMQISGPVHLGRQMPVNNAAHERRIRGSVSELRIDYSWESMSMR